MARVGWCTDCGEWVWLDVEGSCEKGHGPDCVEKVHEQKGLSGEKLASYGVGKIPAVIRRFNWGAFMLPLFWGAAYGSWQIIGVWLFALVSPLFVAALTRTDQAGASISAIIGVTVLGEAVSGLARLWAGANANRLLWQREALRMAVVPESGPRFTVSRFTSRQKLWGLWGAVIVVVGTVATVPFTTSVWEEYGLTYVGALMPVVWLLIEIMLGFWLDNRMRLEPPDAEQGAQVA